jgi:hypothetical protein
MKQLITILAAAVFVCGSSQSTQAAEPDTKAASIRMELSLTDGSKLIGAATSHDLAWELVTEAVGKLTVPAAKVSSVEFSKERQESVIRLTNGDVLRGRITQTEIKLDGLLGRIAIPLTAITRIQIRQRSGEGRALAPEDWDPVPFPVTCDWPGPQGELSRATETGIELRGHPIRTRQAFAFPFVWEFEVEAQEQGTGPEGCDLNFFFFSGGVERDEEPAAAIQFNLNARARGKELTLYPILYESVGDKRRSRKIWQGAARPFALGETYRVRLEFEKYKVTVTINDRTETAPGITVEMREAHIQIWNWQPTSRWLVSNPRLQ